MTPSRRPLAPALFVLSAVLFVLSPVVGVAALVLLPTHGDGFGVVGEAVVAGAVVLALSVLALLLGTVLALVGRRSRPTGPAAGE